MSSKHINKTLPIEANLSISTHAITHSSFEGRQSRQSHSSTWRFSHLVQTICSVIVQTTVAPCTLSRPLAVQTLSPTSIIRPAAEKLQNPPEYELYT
eukprot:5301468-Amphidinium_carterae.1